MQLVIVSNFAIVFSNRPLLEVGSGELEELKKNSKELLRQAESCNDPLHAELIRITALKVEHDVQLELSARN